MKSTHVLFSFALLVLSVIVIAGAVFYQAHTKEQKRIEEAAFSKVIQAGEGIYTTLDGEPISLESYRGKPVFIVAWASWCPQCAEQLALLARVAEETGAKVPILALNRKENKDLIKGYLSLTGTFERLTYIIDTQDHFFKSAEGTAMPEFVLYDIEGNEVFHARGTVTEEELKTLLGSLE
jgi:thiol-disulfide isomerase/thioredoxin